MNGLALALALVALALALVALGRQFLTVDCLTEMHHFKVGWKLCNWMKGPELSGLADRKL